MKNTYYIGGYDKNGIKFERIMVTAESAQEAVNEVRKAYEGFSVCRVDMKCNDWE